jgi:pyruvate-ferredoxin/flavodoxin oxidoreductase
MSDSPTLKTLDGNEAAASIAYRVNEICAIYPITPSSTMGELADQWASEGRTNIWGTVPHVAEMQSEGGAAGAVHGALQTGALTTTFTSSQGLLLMIPNMFKIAGELTPTVFHVAARALAAQALSIFGDHSDVMAARTTGWAMLCASSVQEAHDMALVAHNATLTGRIPFLHFFDGFRTSHEISKIELLADDDVRAMIDDELVFAHRQRALNPDRPVVRGVAQNPDVYFQGRETVNPYYAALPGAVQKAMDRFGALTGRRYKLFDYFGAPDAERVVVLMGSAVETARETIEYLNARGARLGLVQVHLFRPFSTGDLLDSIPLSARSIAVLDRTKEPGAAGEPLYQDVVTSFAEAVGTGPRAAMPRIVGGRYGLSSKEFTPAMVKAVFDNLNVAAPKNHFTIGINDDVSHTSLEYDRDFIIEADDVVGCVFYGLGADGTVGANKNSIKIIGETAGYAQGFFVYDSKKSGSKTISHLRFGPRPIRSTYLVQRARFIACHEFRFVDQVEMLREAVDGAVFLLNSPFGAAHVWDQLPREMQETLIRKRIRFYVIDADTAAADAGMAGRINTIMQTCFFAISGVLPREEAIANIKHAIQTTYGKKGRDLVEKNFAAVDGALAHLFEVAVPAAASSSRLPAPVVPAHAPAFVRNVTAMMMAGRGDELPVSALPADGTYPSGTTQWEKRNISDSVPEWRPATCIQCGNCAMVCPHSVIRARFYDESALASAPAGFPSAPLVGRGYPSLRFTLQVGVEDCTGCELCVEVCPATDGEGTSGNRAINMAPKDPILERERRNLAFFATLPDNRPAGLETSLVRGIQYLPSMFEYSGACAGCGETPYLRLLSQLFGDRLLVANATGCSSIYGGNLPTTPWSVNADGRGPAWANSLFEDNAEFGMGFRLSLDKHREQAVELLTALEPYLGTERVTGILHAHQTTPEGVQAQRGRIATLNADLGRIDDPRAANLRSLTEHLVRRSVWIVGGDGWAYDIGYGGLDHVLASGRNVNILVLDTEVYSNTGGQASKSTPRGAVAKFAAGGKRSRKKDLGLMAVAYGHVYVAQVAMGASAQQTLDAFLEAEAYDGPSIIIAYGHCIAHGIDMRLGMRQQKLAVDCGHWPLYRYKPAEHERVREEFVLDSPAPSIPLRTYASNELRYKMLSLARPDDAERVLDEAQADIDQRWRLYRGMADRWPPATRRGQGEAGCTGGIPAA